MADIQDLDPRLIGSRLAAARKARSITQEQAAKHLGCSRPTLIALEKGERTPKGDEIVTLAALYGRSVHEIVRAGVEPTGLEPHLRAAIKPGGVTSPEMDECISELIRFAEDYRQLEHLLDAKPISAYPPEVVLPVRGDLRGFAEDVALRERDRLGLGTQPVLNLREILETEVGLRVFYGGLPSHIAGMFAYSVELGFCVLINRKHPDERRRATLAHEYGHALSDRHRPGVDYLNGGSRKPASERFAEAFGMSFLMPASGIRRKFHEIASSSGDFQVADLCRLSSFYSVSVQAMSLRLEELGLISRGTWDDLAEKGFRPRKAAEELGLGPRPLPPDEPYPERYKFLAVQAYEQGEISEGQLCRFLRCDPVSARETVSLCLDRHFTDNDGRTIEGRMSFRESLLRSRR